MAYYLKNDRLLVEIAELGEAYQGTRFDGTGIITGVKLDGQHQFCVPESLTPGTGTGGIGICSEFGIKEAIGYEDTRVGEQFPKLGVGCSHGRMKRSTCFIGITPANGLRLRWSKGASSRFVLRPSLRNAGDTQYVCKKTSRFPIISCL